MILLIFLTIFFSEAKIQILQGDGEDLMTHYDPYSKKFKGYFEYTGCDPIAQKDKLSQDEMSEFAKKHFSIRKFEEDKFNELKTKLSNEKISQDEKAAIMTEIKKKGFSFREAKNVKECSTGAPNEVRQVHPNAILAPFYDPSGENENCPPEKMYQKKMPMSISLENHMKLATEKNWQSERIFFTDDFNTCLSHSVKDSALCSPKPIKIKFDSLKLDESDITSLTVSDGKIQIGPNTTHYYDKNSKNWCTKFITETENLHGCHVDKNNIPTEKIMPIQVSREVEENGTKSKKILTLGWVKLMPNGEAELGPPKSMTSFNRENPTNEINKSSGYIKVINTIKEGTIQSKISSFDGSNSELRTLEIVARHVLGDKIDGKSCPYDYCSINSKKYPCISDKLKTVDLSDPQNGTICRSCLGITNGSCTNTEIKSKKFTKSLDEASEKHCKKIENTPNSNESGEISI